LDLVDLGGLAPLIFITTIVRSRGGVAQVAHAINAPIDTTAAAGPDVFALAVGKIQGLIVLLRQDSP